MVQRIQFVVPFLPVPDLNCTAHVGKVAPLPARATRSHTAYRE
jgi:hypothetical protein